MAAEEGTRRVVLPWYQKLGTDAEEEEEETRRLVGAGPAPFGPYKPGAAGAKEAEASWRSSAARRLSTPKKLLVRAAAAARRFLRLEVAPANPVLPAPGDEEETEDWTSTTTSAAAASAPRRAWEAAASALRRAWEWLPLASSSFPRPDPRPIRVGEPLDDFQRQWLEEERLRSKQRRSVAINRRLVTECLEYYNSMHPGNEYKPAPGVVTTYMYFANRPCWTHGNFVARRKRSGFFSFLPAPRTLFFFELVTSKDFSGIVTCTPLDEPVTEAYRFLGIPLGWGTRRSGRSDCICKTCYRHYHNPLKKTIACGHEDVENICDVCYSRTDVLHPVPVRGEFSFGSREGHGVSSRTEKTS